MRPLANTPLTELNVAFGVRPAAPHLPDATDAHRQQGRMLGLIHQHHLHDLARIAKLLAEIERGGAALDSLASAVNDAPLVQNMRRFGTLCGQQCKLLQMHHDGTGQSWLARRGRTAPGRAYGRARAHLSSW